MTISVSRLLPLTAALLAAVVATGCAPDVERPPVRGGLAVSEAMDAGDVAGFARAVEPRAFVFPEDHGPHPGFRTEWWYFTGNLDADGRRLGYQLTLFRSALSARPAERASAWATDTAWLGHLGLSDGGERRMFSFERFSRGALGLAGASARPLEVWLEDWRIAARGDGDGDLPPLSLVADAGEVAIDLELDAIKPIVLQGDRGLSQKGGEPGNASYYYSFTRLATRGSVRLGERRLEVVGESWMDREWSTSALEEGQVGWDWFALQLDDGRELMVYRLRRADGTWDPLSSGTLVAADGSSRPLPLEAVELASTDTWTSPRSGGVYPAGWRLAVPSAGLDLEVRPIFADQEHRTTVVYWEGAVDVSGRGGDGPVSGRGYVELTGYAD